MQRCHSSHLGKQYGKNGKRLKCSEYRSAEMTLPTSLSSKLYLMRTYHIQPKIDPNGPGVVLGVIAGKAASKTGACIQGLTLADGLRKTVGFSHRTSGDRGLRKMARQLAITARRQFERP